MSTSRPIVADIAFQSAVQTTTDCLTRAGVGIAEIVLDKPKIRSAAAFFSSTKLEVEAHHQGLSVNNSPVLEVRTLSRLDASSLEARLLRIAANHRQGAAPPGRQAIARQSPRDSATCPMSPSQLWSSGMSKYISHTFGIQDHHREAVTSRTLSSAKRGERNGLFRR